MYNKVYKKLFVRNAVRLFFAGVSFNFINFFAGVFFSKATKQTKSLLFTNKLLNKKMCDCYKLHEKCEYLKSKLNQKYAPV